MSDEDFEGDAGFSRRSLIKRGAVVGGGLIWAAPVVQTLTRPAFAQVGSASCSFDVILERNGTCRKVGECTAAQECCECLDSSQADCDAACETQTCESVTPIVVPCA